MLRADGTESQKELHGVNATALLVATAEAKEKKKKVTFSCQVLMNFLFVRNTKGFG